MTWFGAMQAQDVHSGLWSFGVRLPGSTLAGIGEALERREAIRTWPMRGTVHFVPPADAHWMLELTGVRALAGANKRREMLGLDEATVGKAVDILGAAVAGGKRLTRAECLVALTESGVEVVGQRGYHLLWYASQLGVTAIAPHVGKEQTFVLLDDWVPSPNRPSREEALGILALRYFRSHGPVTLKDFAGWTGLPMKDVREGVAVAGDALVPVDVEGVPMIAAAEILDSGPIDPASAASGSPGHASSASGSTGHASAASGFTGRAAGDGRPAGGEWVALPGFDEYLLGYKDRSMMVTPEGMQAIIPGGNGMFRSTIVRDGRAVAVWTRTMTRKGVTVTVEPLTDFSSADCRNIVQALEPYATHLGLPLTVQGIPSTVV